VSVDKTLSRSFVGIDGSLYRVLEWSRSGVELERVFPGDIDGDVPGEAEA
jgi:hypothetical protein